MFYLKGLTRFRIYLVGGGFFCVKSALWKVLLRQSWVRFLLGRDLFGRRVKMFRSVELIANLMQWLRKFFETLQRISSQPPKI